MSTFSQPAVVKSRSQDVAKSRSEGVDLSLSQVNSGSVAMSCKKLHPIGSMVWGKLPGYDWWPGAIVSYCGDKERDGDRDSDRDRDGGDAGEGEEENGNRGLQLWVKWYGENNLSKVISYLDCSLVVHATLHVRWLQSNFSLSGYLSYLLFYIHCYR